MSSARVCSRRNSPIERIACIVAEFVVESLEMIEIEHHERDGPISPDSMLEFALQCFFEMAQVEQSGERIANGLLSQSGPQAQVGQVSAVCSATAVPTRSIPDHVLLRWLPCKGSAVQSCSKTRMPDISPCVMSGTQRARSFSPKAKCAHAQA